MRRVDIGPKDWRVLVIDKLTERDVSLEDQPERIKAILNWSPDDECAPLVMNVTNMEFLTGFFKMASDTDCDGKKVAVYFDPKVKFQNKVTGGLRLADPDDEIPFG